MKSRTFKLLLLSLILASNFLLRYPFLNTPLERDEGEYAYIADVIAAHGVPYKDAFDQKPPAVFYLYCLVFHTLGKEPFTLRLFAAFYNLLSILFVFLIGRELKNGIYGLVSALIFALVSSDRRLLGFSANTELFMLAPSILAVWLALLYVKRDRSAYLCLSGFSCGIAVLFKQPALMSFAAIILFTAWHGAIKKKKIAATLGGLGAACACFALPLLITLLWFLHANALKDFLYQVVGHNLDYINDKAGAGYVLENLLKTLGFILESQWALWLFLLAGIVAALGEKRDHIVLVLVWFLFSAAGVSLGRRFTLHYFLQLSPAFSLLAGCGFFAVLKLLTGREAAKAGWNFTFIFLLLTVAAPPACAGRQYFRFSPAQLTRLVYSGNPFLEDVTIGGYLGRNSRPGDRVFVIGSEPQILFYANRRSASRYIFFYPLTGAYPDTLAKQKEVLEELSRELPEYIVYVNHARSLGTSTDTEMYIFDRLNGLLQSSYRMEGVVNPDAPGHLYAAKELDTLPAADKGLYTAPRIFIYRKLHREKEKIMV